jgi:hypothetical protein
LRSLCRQEGALAHQARRIYQRVGFELVEQDNHHSFGHDLVGQYWIKDLAAG